MCSFQSGVLMPGRGGVGLLLLGADRVGGDGLAAAKLRRLDLAEAEVASTHPASGIVEVPRATIGGAVNDKVWGGDFTAAVACARPFAGEVGAGVCGGADEGEGEDDGLEHLWSLQGNKQVATNVVRALKYSLSLFERRGAHATA